MLDFGQVIKDCYDPVVKAIRITEGGVAVTLSRDLDGEQIIQRVYDPDEHALKIINVGSPSGETGAVLSFEQIMKKILDEAEGKLQTVT